MDLKQRSQLDFVFGTHTTPRPVSEMQVGDLLKMLGGFKRMHEGDPLKKPTMFIIATEEAEKMPEALPKLIKERTGLDVKVEPGIHGQLVLIAKPWQIRDGYEKITT